MHPCLVMRHGIAVERARDRRDEDAGLSPEGMEEVEQIGAGLAVLVRPPMLVISSPCRRAIETADLVSAAFGGVPTETVDALSPGALPEDILRAVAEHCPGDRSGIGVIGHEPDLGRFVSRALSGTGRSFYSFRKGATCLLEFPAVPREGNATLEWALDPGHLIAVGAAVRRRLTRRAAE